MFLIGILGDELNPNRDVLTASPTAEEEEEEALLQDGASAEQAWLRHKSADNSIICNELAGQATAVIVCNDCGNRVRKHDLLYQLLATIPPGGMYKKRDLHDQITTAYSESSTVNVPYNCAKCGHDESTKTDWLSAFPNYLFIQIVRFEQNSKLGKFTKERTPLLFDADKDFDLWDCFLPMEGQTRNDIPQQNGKCKYRPIAVVVHSGDDIGGGHFWTVARHVDQKSKAREWHKYNDSTVTQADYHEATQGEGTYLVLMQKQEN